MQLWSGVLSPFSAKVRIALAEKGLAAEVQEVPWSRETLWGPKPPEFLAVSPRGQVPVLIDDGTAIYDSTVILEYLEERNPEPALFPQAGKARAQCRQLEDEADWLMQQSIVVLIREVFMKPDETQRDHELVATATKELQTYYANLENTLNGKEYLCGVFSVADIATFMVVGFGTTLGVGPGQEHSRLHSWFERMQARPAVGGEFQAMMQAAATA